MLQIEVEGISERIAHLKDEIMRRGGAFMPQVNPFARSVALWRAAQPGRSRVQVRAAYLLELVKLAPLQIEPEWRLVGNHLPTTQVDFKIPDPGQPEHLRQLQALGVDADQAEGVAQAVRQWHIQRWTAVGESQGEAGRGYPGPNNGSDTVFWSIGWVENHSIRDYAKVLRLGFAGIRQEVEHQLSGAQISDPEFPQKENFWKAALSICDAGILLGRRYGDLAIEQANQAETVVEIQWLEEIAAVCDQVPAEGARTFVEAVQSIWLAHILTCGEDGINANSLGRLDQILYPYYHADIEAGRLSRAEAVELMEELACRLYLGYDVQAITLGGVDRQGRDAVNELSAIILEATHNVELVRDLSVRLSPSSPPAFVDQVSQLIIRGGGLPFMFNDDCFIGALADRGIALEDARDYSPIGCIELTIPGRASPHAVSGEFCSTKCLELALFDGQDPQTGGQVGPHTGLLSSFTAFEELYAAYCRQVEYFSHQMVYHINRGELAQREGGPLPCLSVLTDDCITRGRDITDGGVVYNYHSICFIGTATTADALMALKKFVFEEKTVGTAEILGSTAPEDAQAGAQVRQRSAGSGQPCCPRRR
jgi:pyruvate-formate lyase